MHRQAKGVELSYEDEKFSYVAAVGPAQPDADTPYGRIVRRPQQRKGLVMLDLCVRDGSVTTRTGEQEQGRVLPAGQEGLLG